MPAICTYGDTTARGTATGLVAPAVSRRGGRMARWPFELEQFDYHRFIEDYFRRFGENRVLVLPFELLRHDGSDFVWRLVRFAGARAEESVVDDLPFGVRVNQANGSVYVAARRRLNLIMRDRLTPGGVSTGEAERA